MVTQSHSTNTDDPVALAKRAIELLEARLRDEFGVKAVMGAELEFAIRTRGKGPSALLDPLLALPIKEQIINSDHRPDLEREDQTPDPFFPRDEHAAYSYLERDQRSTHARTYETVLSHLAPYRDLNHLGDEINAKRQHMLNIHNWDSKWDAVKHRVRTDFASMDRTKVSTRGLHLNTSLVRASDGKNLIAPQENDPLAYALIQSSIDMSIENIFLQIADAKAIDRWKSRDDGVYLEIRQPKKEMVDGHLKEERIADYIENTMPPAGANPHYIILLQLAGIYDALKQNHFALSDESETPAYRIDAAPAARYKNANTLLAFDRSILNVGIPATFANNPLKPLLNDLESNLGDRFVDAALAHPETRALPEAQRTR